MTDELSPSPPVTPATNPVSSPVTGGTASPPPTPPVAPIKKPGLPKRTIFIIGGILLLGILVFSILFLQSNGTPQNSIPTAPTPTVFITPTPQPNLSRIATTSAFQAFREEVASFSATLNSFTLQDPAFAPPVFETELEFKN